MPSDKEDWRLLRTRRSTEMEKILTRMALVSSLPGKGIVWIDCGGDVRNSKMSNNSIFDVSLPPPAKESKVKERESGREGFRSP